MLSHDLARALLAHRNNDVRVEVLTYNPADDDTPLLRQVELRDGGFLTAEDRVDEADVVAYDADRDAIIVRAGFVVVGEPT